MIFNLSTIHVHCNLYSEKSEPRWVMFVVTITTWDFADYHKKKRKKRNIGLWRWIPHRLLKHQLQPTRVLLRTTPTWTINQPQTLTHLGYNQQQSFSGLHQPGQSTSHKPWLTWVTTNNSPSQDYTNLDNQSTTNLDSPGLQPTTVLLRTTPAWTINQPQTLTHLGYNQQQSFSGLHQPGQSINHKPWLTWVTTNNSPSQDYTSLDNQSTTNLDSPGLQPTTVLLRTTPAWTINQPQTLTHLGYNQQQSFSGLHQPGQSINHKPWLTWVTTNNSPSQDYTSLDNQSTTNLDSPGLQPTTVLLRTTPAWTINQPQTLTHLGYNQQQSFSGLHQPGQSTHQSCNILY